MQSSSNKDIQSETGYLRILLLGLILFFMLPVSLSFADKLHPLNKRLIDAGYMPYPKYYPHVPRVPAYAAKHYYDSGKATFVLVSHSNRDLIFGARHLTEDMPGGINPANLLIKKDHILVLY